MTPEATREPTPEPTQKAVITAKGLTKRYRATTAVDDLNLEIHAGEVFGLLGPNGAGKTTTILMLLGLTEPTAGSVKVLGLDPRHHALEVKADVGYLPDSVGFYDHLTGRQNLRYTARLNRLTGDERDRRIDEVLAMVGLSEVADRAAGDYSRGMRQRLGLADALLKRPKVLILDEPTVNIDPAGVEEILALVRHLAREEGVAVLLSSHLLHQVQSICDRIGIFVAGKLAAIGTIDQLVAALDDRVLVEVGATGPTPVVVETITDVEGVSSIEADGDYWLVAADTDVRSAIADALHDAGCAITQLREVSAELDAIYRRYFQTQSEVETTPAVVREAAS